VRCFVWLVGAVLASGPAAASEGFGTFSRTIAAGEADEQCFRLEKGELASWRFDTSAAVDFNLHWHRGSEVHYPVKRNGVRRDRGQFAAPHADDYCLMWENKGTVAVELKGEVVKGKP
jgi:hypothetical protein